MTTFLAILAQYGLPGIVIGLQYVWIWRQESRYQKLVTDKSTEIKAWSTALGAEQAARVADANRYTTLALELQQKVLTAVSTLGNLLSGHNRSEYEE